NEDGHNFIQYSVINRSEKIYNLLYEMSDHKNIYKTIKDSSGNNLLHLAARLAPTKKLNLISGAALQIQRELQWFQEVERFVCPLNRIQNNTDDETPEMVFTREHKNLVIEGENWIKKTAESYTITAALIVTIVFAAAITVPGGNNQESGIPVFTNNIAFTVFAISDAISLFTAVTSLLINDHSFWSNIIPCVWRKKLVDGYSNRCIDMPSNYVFCDLAMSSYGGGLFGREEYGYFY
nr:ankyrin repeat-containing domain, PGG domain protein [Tanacetum cinerariifolium]